MVFVALGLCGLVQASLADDGVDADGRLAGRAVADDQLALPAADRDHRVDRHDARLHRLTDRTPTNDPRRQLLDRVRHVANDRALAVQRLAECVHHPAEQPFADRHLKQFARTADFTALCESRVVAEDDDADLRLVEIERQSGDALPEIEHLVQHHVAQSFDPGNAVADLANDANVLSRDGGLGTRDLRFDVP